MGEGEVMECAKCGDTFDALKVKKVPHMLYGIVKEELLCPHCGKGPVYYRDKMNGGRNTLSGSYLNTLKV